MKLVNISRYGGFFSSRPLKVQLDRGRLSKTIQGKARSITGKICRKTHGVKGGTVLILGPSTTDFPMQRQNWAGRGRQMQAQRCNRRARDAVTTLFLAGMKLLLLFVKVLEACLLCYLFDMVSQFILCVLF